MNAATLMKSGTVTKNPAMKLRRSHSMVLQPARCDRSENRQTQPDPIPGKRCKSRPSDEQQERRDHEERGEEGRDQADADLQGAVRRKLMPDLEQIVRKGRGHRRHGEK